LRQNFYIKDGFRILAIDDAHFNKFRNTKTLIFGIITRGAYIIEKTFCFHIKIDGNCITEKLYDSIKKEKLYENLHLIMTAGITFGGFNILDIINLYERLKIPTIVSIDRKPNIERIREIIKGLFGEEKLKIFDRQPKIEKINGIYTQYVGLKSKEVEIILKKLAITSKLPEPVMIAHRIASGIGKGILDAYCSDR